MRSTDLFGFFLLFLLDFWRPAEGLCSLENNTIATCTFLKDVQEIKTENLITLKASVAEDTLTSHFLQNLTSLKHLDLSKGNLSKILPGTFVQLPQLHSLNLAENHLKDLNSSSLEGLKKLRSLGLKKNNFNHLPEALLDLKNLKFLDVTRNNIDCNCATLRVRDKLVEKGIKIGKKAVCSGPVGVKGWSLLKPTSELVCIFEEQDEGMQNDQPVKDDEEDFGSGDEVIDDDEGEFEDDTPKTEAETPVPETPVPFIENVTPKIEIEIETELPIEITEISKIDVTSTKPVEDSLEKNKLKGAKEEFFFENDEKSSTEAIPQTEKSVKFDQFPIEGSGDDDEGSGTLTPPIDFTKKREEESVKDSIFDKDATDSGSLFDRIFGSWPETTSTVIPEEKTPKFSEMEKEEFLPVKPEKATEADGMLVKNVPDNVPQKEIDKTIVKDNVIKDGETKQELADASQDSKTGNAPMVVLIVLLGIFVALLILAAYKGDFCKKKRVPDDVERGTELKEMRKSLLEGGNAQPKLSNGNTESVPLIKVPLNDKEKETLHRNGVNDSPAEPSQDSLDPVKPPRKSIPQDELKLPTNGKTHQPPDNFKVPLNLPQNELTAPPNTPMTDFGSPPLSPDAQRVKIILQENPDSVPKTPILITRTKMGENLVKTP